MLLSSIHFVQFMYFSKTVDLFLQTWRKVWWRAEFWQKGYGCVSQVISDGRCWWGSNFHILIHPKVGMKHENSPQIRLNLPNKVNLQTDTFIFLLFLLSVKESAMLLILPRAGEITNLMIVIVQILWLAYPSTAQKWAPSPPLRQSSPYKSLLKWREKLSWKLNKLLRGQTYNWAWQTRRLPSKHRPSIFHRLQGMIVINEDDFMKCST